MKISELKAKAGLSPDTRVYDAQKAKKRQETSNQAGGKTVAFTPMYIRVPFSDEDLSLRESLEKRLEPTSLGRSFHARQEQAQAQRAFKTVMEQKEVEAPIGVPLISLSPGGFAATEPTQSTQSTWLQQPAVFADGWQFGDGMTAAGATMNDLGTNVLSGALGIGEKMVDAGAYYVGGIGGLLGQEDFQNRVRNFVADDLYDEQELARKFFSPWKRDHLAEKLGLDPAPVGENSLFGDKADSLAQAGGQLLGQALLTKLGIPYQLTSAATSFGGEVENALRSGATYGEAGISGLITAGSEVLLEQISGGINFANIGTLDRGMSKWLANTISGDMLRYVAQLGVDIFGEGMEEVFSDAIAKFGRWLTYQDEYTLEQLYLSEEARQEALDAFFGGVLFGLIANSAQVSSPVNQDSIAYVTDTDPANPKMGVTPSLNVNDPGSWDLSLLPPKARKDAAAYLSQLQHLQTTQALLTQKEGILKSQLEAEKPNPTLIDQTHRDITKLEGMVGVQSDKLRQMESLPTIQKLATAQPIGVTADVELCDYFGASSTDNLSAIIKRGTIKLSNGFSCFPEGDPLTNNVQNVPPMDNYYDVAMHGSSTMVGFGSTEANMSARLLANMIRHSEGYDGQKIRLLSCYTGQSVDGDYCFAEELANALGVEVMAPNGELYIWPSGEYYVGDDGSGEFVIYEPNQRRRIK